VELLVKRYWPNNIATIGALYVDGANECFSLELPLTFEGNENVPNVTCILAGRFRILLQPSPHFEASKDPWVKQYVARMPHLQNVPGRSYVMVHFGDLPADTDGCILVGNVRTSMTAIGDSRAAFEVLFNKINAAITAGQEVWITLENDGEPQDAWP
jgi:Steigviridae/Suoliviridae L,D-carboxypeptidase/transpeptidase